MIITLALAAFIADQAASDATAGRQVEEIEQQLQSTWRNNDCAKYWA